MLRIVEWYLFTDVSRQSNGLIFRGELTQELLDPLKMERWYTETSVTSYQSTLHNISEERRGQTFLLYCRCLFMQLPVQYYCCMWGSECN